MHTNKLCAAMVSLLGSGHWCQHWLEYLLILSRIMYFVLQVSQ